MKFKLLLAIIITCLSFQLQASSRDDLEGEFKGNWTKTFRLKNGEALLHTPKRIQLGFLTCGKGLTLEGYYNGMALSPAGLHLLTNSTEEEFVKALRASGLYK